MTNFEKALQAAASVFANCRNGKFAAVNSEEWIRSFEGHKEGARWGREFAVKEVCDYLKSLEDKYYYSCEGGMSPIEWADIVKQHFKDRGGE